MGGEKAFLHSTPRIDNYLLFNIFIISMKHKAAQLEHHNLRATKIKHIFQFDSEVVDDSEATVESVMACETHEKRVEIFNNSSR